MQGIGHTDDGRAEKTIGNSEATERLEMETLNPGLAGGTKGGGHVTRTQRLGSPLEVGTIVRQHSAGVGATENTQPWQRERRRKIPWLFRSSYLPVSCQCLPLDKSSRRTADMTA